MKLLRNVRHSAVITSITDRGYYLLLWCWAAARFFFSCCPVSAVDEHSLVGKAHPHESDRRNGQREANGLTQVWTVPHDNNG